MTNQPAKETDLVYAVDFICKKATMAHQILTTPRHSVQFTPLELEGFKILRDESKKVSQKFYDDEKKHLDKLAKDQKWSLKQKAQKELALANLIEPVVTLP